MERMLAMIAKNTPKTPKKNKKSQNTWKETINAHPIRAKKDNEMTLNERETKRKKKKKKEKKEKKEKKRKKKKKREKKEKRTRDLFHVMGAFFRFFFCVRPFFMIIFMTCERGGERTANGDGG